MPGMRPTCCGVRQFDYVALMSLSQEEIVIVIRLLASVLIGGLIGFERSFHGRPAGFRTHTLVCLASTLLMLVTVYQDIWMTHMPLDAIRTDPTRMAQGIMTGIGFLGAGVIFKEGLTVRGLTTAASIWVTAALGIVVGIGFYLAAALGAVIVLAILSLFRWIEGQLPSEHYAHLVLGFARTRTIDEARLRKMIADKGFSIANLSSRLTDRGEIFEYRMMIRSRGRDATDALSQHLRALPEVTEFRISPTGD
jgi:putative Mg2+ transporter-C (MgtC) family protein